MAGYYIAFHGGKGRAMDRVIAWATRSRFSHCELLRAERMPAAGETHTCVGASLMDGGVRIRAIVFDAGKWYFVHVPWAPAETWERAAARARLRLRPAGLRVDAPVRLSPPVARQVVLPGADRGCAGHRDAACLFAGDLLRLVGDHSATWQAARRARPRGKG